MKRQKKAQLQMTETVAVLVVFFILLMFGLLFYTRFQRSALDEQRASRASVSQSDKPRSPSDSSSRNSTTSGIIASPLTTPVRAK
jgi:cytoskeletal protein RodZ